MKQVRILLWCAVAIVAGFASYAVLNKPTKPTGSSVAGIQIGGDFNLVSHKGEAITREDLLGNNHAIFFGFTHCPDICPGTLLEAASWLKDLGGDAEKVNFYFFSVDPARDTPEILNDYVNAFDQRITGITGDETEMAQTIKSYKAYSKKVLTGEEIDDYTMDHSASVMLFSQNGDFKGTISYGENNDVALEKLRRLAKNG